MKYMDLVDTNNGNVYVTAKSEDGQDATVTVTWPMPTDADENGTFYVVHFKDLDREFEGSKAVSNIENAETEVIQAEVTEGVSSSAPAASLPLYWSTAKERQI